ncbi:sigma factor-like helix-turn-helix DNA-binding protein [Streptomyces sp. NPDC001219]
MNLTLVHYVARHSSGRRESTEVMPQVGTIGPIETINRYDAQRGVAFTTQAIPYLQGEFKRFLPRLAEVDDHDRTLLALRFDAEMPQSEIGEELNLSQMHLSPSPPTSAYTCGSDAGHRLTARTATTGRSLPLASVRAWEALHGADGAGVLLTGRRSERLVRAVLALGPHTAPGTVVRQPSDETVTHARRSAGPTSTSPEPGGGRRSHSTMWGDAEMRDRLAATQSFRM